jgi:hypothetical protein
MQNINTSATSEEFAKIMDDIVFKITYKAGANDIGGIKDVMTEHVSQVFLIF